MLGRHNTWLAAKTGWALLKSNEKRSIAGLGLTVTAAAALDLLAISSVMPAVMLIVEPDSITKRPEFDALQSTIGSSSLETTIPLIGIAVINLLAIATVINLFVQRTVIRFGAKCSSRLADDVMRECLVGPYIWFLGQNSTVLTRLVYADIAHWGTNYVQRLLTITHNVATLILAVVLIVIAAPLKGLAALTVVALMGWGILSIIRPAIQQLSHRTRIAADEVVKSANQAFSGIKDIKLSSRSDYFADLYGNAFNTAVLSRAKINFLKMTPSYLLVFLSQLALLLLTGAMWFSGLTSGAIAGQTALLLLVTSKFIPALNRLSGDFTTFWDSFPYIDGIRQTLESIRRHQSDDLATTHAGTSINWQIFSFENVEYGYPNSEKKAVYGIDFRFRPGYAYGIAGPSGAGKSTLVDMIVGLLFPSTGQILVDGQLLEGQIVKDWQAGIGYVPQHPFIADASLRENVAFGVPVGEIDDAHIHDCLRLANLEGVIATLPEGLDTILGDRGTRLSGGQRQRVAIARALYNNPSILVLDEATSALDLDSEKAVQEAINLLHGKVTTVTIAHRLTTIQDCDEILLMEDGAIIDRGSFTELAKTHPNFRNALSEKDEIPV